MGRPRLSQMAPDGLSRLRQAVSWLWNGAFLLAAALLCVPMARACGDGYLVT